MKDLTVGKEGKLIFEFAAPMLLGNVFQQLYNIVDSIVIGQFIGKEALAAIGASFPLIFLLISLIIGLTMGSTIIISQYFGAKDMDKVRKAIDTLYIYLFIASIILTVIGIVFCKDIFRLINLPENIIPMATSYLTVYFTGFVFFFGFNGISAVLRGMGDSKTPLYFLIIATITNVILDLLFVVVFHWGVVGVAIATVISQALAFALAVLYLNKKHEIIHLSFGHKFFFDKEIFNQSIRIGLPTGFQQAFVALGALALFWIVNMFGTDTIAAYSAAYRIDTLASLPAMNFAAALTTFVGQNLGANKPDRVRKGLLATFFMTSIITLSITTIAIFFSKPLMSMFTPDKEVIEIGSGYLIIVGSFYIAFSTMFVVGAVMRGAGATLIPMFITLVALWGIRIPVSYFLSQEIGVHGIWWGIPIAWFIGLVCSYLYYLYGNWKTKVVVKYME